MAMFWTREEKRSDKGSGDRKSIIEYNIRERERETHTERETQRETERGRDREKSHTHNSYTDIITTHNQHTHAKKEAAQMNFKDKLEDRVRLFQDFKIDKNKCLENLP